MTPERLDAIRERAEQVFGVGVVEVRELLAEIDRLNANLRTVQNAAKTLAAAQGSELEHRRQNANYDHKIRSEHDSLIERDAIMTAENERLSAALTAAKEENERLRKATESPRKGYPILNSQGAKIDWQLVADHGEQARKNHYQTVEGLANRGGLSWCEMYAVLHNKPWQKMEENEAMIACRALEARYLAARNALGGDNGASDENLIKAADVLEYRP